MKQVTIQDFTTKYPLQMIGFEAGICWNGNVLDDKKNIKRAIDCINSGHGRTMEFPDVYMTIDGYSARVIREWYTHIGGSPTRLQSSTRYIDYSNFDYIVPDKIRTNTEQLNAYNHAMANIRKEISNLINLGVPKEDAALLLPLGMTTKIVCKHNLRNLVDMSHQRLCTRAYWEYRELFKDIMIELSNYSEEWKIIVDNCFKPKCELNVPPLCFESKCCGKHEKADIKLINDNI
jgi:thymidylate synthase (FAD)